jgi:S-adenosylmethionine decarboxylase
MSVVGKHYFGELYGCPKDLLSDENFLYNLINNAVKISNSKLLDIKYWKVDGDRGGISIIAIVLESHIALHTWPNQGFATLDVYTCGEHTDPEKAFDYIVKNLKPKRYIKKFSSRTMEKEYNA